MLTKVQKWGNSLALRIPSAFAAEIDIEPNTDVEITVQDGRLIITPIAGPVYDLAELLANVTDDNLHGEVQVGPSVGSESW